MPVKNFSTSVVAGIGSPMFHHFIDGVFSKEIEFPEPQGASLLTFTPDEQEYMDVNRRVQVINYGYNIKLEINYSYIDVAEMQSIIQAWSWRSFEPTRNFIKCFPHRELSTFWFKGRFVGELPFDYPNKKYLAHTCKIIFESTEKVNDIPRHTANLVMKKKVF